MVPARSTPEAFHGIGRGMIQLAIGIECQGQTVRGPSGGPSSRGYFDLDGRQVHRFAERYLDRGVYRRVIRAISGRDGEVGGSVVKFRYNRLYGGS